MANVSVPKKFHKGLENLLQLDVASFEVLTGALSKLPIKLYPKDEILDAVSSVRGILADDRKEITDAIMSLFLNRASFDRSTDVFVSEILESLQKSSTLSDEKIDLSHKRLVRILEINSLFIASKATSVLFGYERSYAKARVFTDIRPIFDKVDNSPQAAVVVHTLSIHYHQDNEHKEFFIAMDDGDINKLIQTLERAKSKSKSLQDMLSKAKVTFVEAE